MHVDGKNERIIQFDPAKMRHFDHGYAVTSHVSQGLTEGRVIANINTDSAHSLINTRLAYVAVSRAEHDVRIYTDDAEGLGARLATKVTKTAAIDFRRPSQPAQGGRQDMIIYEYEELDHRLAAVARAYAERPANTVVLAQDRAERERLNHLIRCQLQAQGRVAPAGQSATVLVEQNLKHPEIATQYAPGDRIRYRRGSQGEGIFSNSAAVVLAIHLRTNQLTVRTSTGDEITYSPQRMATATAQSTVYRLEDRKFAQGERIRLTESTPQQRVRRGDFGTVTAISGADGMEVRLDRGQTVQLTKEQAQHIEYGYAVEHLKVGAPERVLITQGNSSQAMSEVASHARSGREVRIYTSDGSAPANIQNPAITLPEQLKPTIAAPEQQQTETPANVLAPDQGPAIHHRQSHGR